MNPYIALAVLSALALDASAQTKTPALPQPTDPAANVEKPRYHSAFEDYVPFREQELVSWPKVNEEVGQAGGHVGIFRGGHAGHGGAAKPAPTKPAPSQPPAGKDQPAKQAPQQSAPQGGHQGH
jgi:hypothetical protein